MLLADITKTITKISRPSKTLTETTPGTVKKRRSGEFKT
jgi:hypothetical protein